MVKLIMVKYGTIQPCEHDKKQTIDCTCILINFSHIAYDEDEAYCF